MGALSESMRMFSGITAVTLVFNVAAIIIVLGNRSIDRTARATFVTSLATLAVISLADWFCTLINGQFPELRNLHAILIAMMFALAPFIPVSISNTICPERFFKWISAVFLVHALFQFASIFGGFAFYVDESNVYHRGPLYFVYMIVYTFSSLYLVVESIRVSRIYQTVSALALIGIFACLATGVIIQVVDGSVRTTWPGASMAVVLYFMFFSDMVLRTDALTKLLNRHSYEEFLSKPPLPCIVVIIDIDNFKHVNDTYGHAFGDECLEQVASSIKKTFGNAGLCYRTGGDEFTVVMTKQLAEVDKLVAELYLFIDQQREENTRLPSLSVGYELADTNCEHIKIAIEAADQAMYRTKAEHKSH